MVDLESYQKGIESVKSDLMNYLSSSSLERYKEQEYYWKFNKYSYDECIKVLKNFGANNKDIRGATRRLDHLGYDVLFCRYHRTIIDRRTNKTVDELYQEVKVDQ